MYDVIALGELLIDFTARETDEDGYPTMAAHAGGAPANYLAAMAPYGLRTALIAKVGNDSFGTLLKRTLCRVGISADEIITADEVFTTLAFVTLDENGNREFSFSRKPGADTMLRTEELPMEKIAEARVFHFGTLSLTDEPARSATQAAVALARSAGLLVTFDPNLRKPLWKDLAEARKQILQGLQQADVVKISDDEVDFLWGLSPEKGAEKIIEEFGVRLVFVTCGAEGCCYQNRRAAGRVPALCGIAAADTTGAGDIFGGTAVCRLLQSGKAPEELSGTELEEITRYACAAAGLSTTRPGGISSVPSPEEVRAALEKQK